MLPQAVIFDVDGLLVDTETCDYEAWRELYEEHGLSLTLSEYCCDAGLYGVWERRYELLAQVGGESAEALHARRDPRFRELVQERLRPSPELLELIAALRREGLRLGVASSSDAEWVGMLLDSLGIRGEFEAIVTGDDVAQRKPAPDVYRLASRWLEAEPQVSVALEDSSHGIEAAKAAGMAVIAIPNPVSTHQDLARADARVEHFGEVTLDLLRRLMSGRAPEKPPVRVAGVALHRDGRVLMQHRDENPAIPWPGAWAFFGGHMEPGETPEETARREIEEELELRLEGPLELIHHGAGAGLERFIFAAPLEAPLEALTQHEGQGMALIAREEFDRYQLVPLHRRILEEWLDSSKK